VSSLDGVAGTASMRPGRTSRAARNRLRRLLESLAVADDCIRDDITECDCPRCAGNAAAWERVQGWEPEPGAPWPGLGNGTEPDNEDAVADLDDDEDETRECSGCGVAIDPPHRLCDHCFGAIGGNRPTTTKSSAQDSIVVPRLNT
jgi:hypothetical protein